MDKNSENIQLNEYNNRKIVVSTKQGTPFRMQFPRMYMPFGVSGFTPEVGQTKYNIDFAIKGYEEDDSYMKKYYDSIRKIEDMVIDSVTEQSERIFGKKMTRAELVPMFNSNIKISNDREPKFRVKVDTDMEDNIKAPIYNSDKIVIKDEVSNGLYARNSGHAIVELNSVYFLNRMFGCTWKLYQLVVYEPQNLKGFQFIV
jgi:hypothetical protein|tara:strand:- start:720 stop:1322 length:603 start_codon:yes stop_codon:yes gene_type:complete